MGMLIAVLVVAVLGVGSMWVWNRGAMSNKSVTMTLGLALVAASVLYWISERAA